MPELFQTMTEQDSLPNYTNIISHTTKLGNFDGYDRTGIGYFEDESFFNQRFKLQRGNTNYFIRTIKYFIIKLMLRMESLFGN